MKPITCTCEARHLLQPADPFLHFPPRLEGDDQFGGHIHCLPGAGVACPSRSSLLDLEDPEIAKLNAALVQQRLRDAIKDTLDDLPGLPLGEAHFLGNRSSHVFLGHEQSSLANQNVPMPSRQGQGALRESFLRGMVTSSLGIVALLDNH
jgi:hypothetical protein